MADQSTTIIERSPLGSRPVELYGQAGLATYVAAKIFGAGALPDGAPDWLRDAVARDANFARRLPGAAQSIIGGAWGGPLGVKTKEERLKEADAQSIDRLRLIVREADRQRELERCHEEQWLSEVHSYAGETRSGREWKAMIEWFRDADNTAQWEHQMMAETGQSQDEVRRTGGKMKRFYDLMEKDAKGTLHDSERTEFDMLQRDRELRRGLVVQEEMQGIRASRNQDQTLQSDAAHDANQSVSVSTRASLFDDDASSGLAVVKPITPAYQTAASGDAPAPARIKAAPAVATNTIQLSPDNMFG